ncbi:MAG: hypothetical protein KJ864_04640, partial [Candidatus Omnitrophica bacterium]|nr:hypothetical protein [Candidatus Omnitrophota bacterium]
MWASLYWTTTGQITVQFSNDSLVTPEILASLQDDMSAAWSEYAQDAPAQLAASRERDTDSQLPTAPTGSPLLDHRSFGEIQALWAEKMTVINQMSLSEKTQLYLDVLAGQNEIAKE